jgi:hypothetical protein
MSTPERGEPTGFDWLPQRLLQQLLRVQGLPDTSDFAAGAGADATASKPASAPSAWKRVPITSPSTAVLSATLPDKSLKFEV